MRTSLACVAFLTLSSALLAKAPGPVSRTTPFDHDWLFERGDPAGAAATLAYTNAKPWELPTSVGFMNADRPKPKRPDGDFGTDVSYTQPGFDDHAWRKIDVPHDWGVEGPFDQALDGSTGKLPWAGVGWYRKHFKISPEAAGRLVEVQFDGAMAYSEIWLNGHFVGGWPYGYTSFRVDLTPYMNAGGDNVLCVRLDNPPDSSRWYPGSGIFRNVWLIERPPLGVAPWGLFVTTPRISGDSAEVRIQATLENRTSAKANLSTVVELFEILSSNLEVEHGLIEASPVIVQAEGPAQSVPEGHQALQSISLTLSKPKLWSIDSPHLYRAVVLIKQDGRTIDRSETDFGVRSIAFDPVQGFLLNGKRVPLQGVCDHADIGALGSAIDWHGLKRQLTILKEMGCNAIRTSHNPPAPELLDLCDRMGLVVMDEAFDCWRAGKRPNDYHLLFDDWSEQDMRALVRRDRNHPAIVLWSIGNEVSDQRTPEGWKLAQYLAGIVRSEDRTRFITSACNYVESGYNGFEDVLDVMGYNYKGAEYPKFRESNPSVPLIGSETSSCVSSRGEYFFPVLNEKAAGFANFQVSSYDLYAPKWATPPDAEFRDEDAVGFVGGEFVWTGFDYLGEPTPYNKDVTNLLNFTDPADQAKMKKQLDALGKLPVPSRSSYFGIVDLAGFKKDRFYLYQARWRPDLPMAHLLPHWTWPDRVGQVTPVMVYTSGDSAELFLNGKSLGKKTRGPQEYRLRWDDVVYQPGELHVVAYKNGAKWAEDSVRTAGPAAKIVVTTDRATVQGVGSGLVFLTAVVVDKDGTPVPQSHPHLSFACEGPGSVVAVDNGDATSHAPFQATAIDAYNGMALAIVRVADSGPVRVIASNPGLQSGSVTINAAQ